MLFLKKCFYFEDCEYEIHLISCNSIVVGGVCYKLKFTRQVVRAGSGHVSLYLSSHITATSRLIHLHISGSVFSSLALNPAGYSSLSNGYSGASYPGYNQPGYGCLGAYPGVPTSFSSMSPYTQDPLSMAGYGMSSLSSGTTIASPDSSLKPDVR